jgi:hypothetical protein
VAKKKSPSNGGWGAVRLGPLIFETNTHLVTVTTTISGELRSYENGVSDPLSRRS